MTPTPLAFLLHGSSQPPPPPRPLRAGPLTVLYQSGDLRSIRLGSIEVLRRIYGAVRDQNWGTVPGTRVEEVIEATPDAFRISYLSRHHQGPIRFSWFAHLVGEPDGTLRFRFSGRAESTFSRNRIGLCVLHPIFECAGKPCQVRRLDGSSDELTFPGLVACRQPIPGFLNLASLAHPVTDSLWAEVRFLGDVFETEDQRNWTDASFKTYGTPLALPFPVEIAEGTEVVQEVEVRLVTAAGSRSRPVSAGRELSGAPAPIDVRFSDTSDLRLPELGVSCASHGQPLGPSELRRLSTLGLSHLRFDLHLGSASWTEALRVTARDALELGLPLELAVHLSPRGASDPAELDRLAVALQRARVDLVRILILQDGRPTTPPLALALARDRLADLAAPLGAGTAADLYQLHLDPPPRDADFIAWSMNPQVHAVDLASIAETPEGAAHQVAAVAHAYPGLPGIVSPITLKPRFNPVATADDVGASAGLPPEVDPRQMSLFGAGWTLGMLAALAPSGIESMTFFETSGWRGMLETAAGSHHPELFPSTPGCVFPVFHLFADLAPLSRARVMAASSSAPGTVALLGLRQENQLSAWFANLTDRPQSIRFSGLGPEVQIRMLDASNVVEAVNEPERYRSQARALQPTMDHRITVALPPFALARVVTTAP